jgi:hypothetical protein
MEHTGEIRREERDARQADFTAAALAEKRPESAVQIEWDGINWRDCSHLIEAINYVDCVDCVV